MDYVMDGITLAMEINSVITFGHHFEIEDPDEFFSNLMKFAEYKINLDKNYKVLRNWRERDIIDDEWLAEY